MQLTLDIGNSAIKGAFFDDDGIHSPWRIPYASNWKKLLRAQLTAYTITRAGLCSVVPERTAHVTTILSRIPTLTIHSRLRLPFTLAYQTPDTLGSDRLAAAAAAWQLHGKNSCVVAVDAGTTVTYEVIDSSGTYRGGAIACGPHMLSHALKHGTSQLPLTKPVFPKTVIGRSTREAIQIGVMVAFLDQVRGMLQHIREELGETPIIVATGGWHALLKKHIAAINYTDPLLVLRGVHLLMMLNPHPT